MKRKLIQGSVFTAAVLLLSGCGDGGSTSSAVSTGTATYIDSAVEGCTVTCGSTVSMTDVNGQFTYEGGRDCVFTIGDIELRTESNLYQDKVIIEDKLQTAQFLQSMDWDGNPANGIKILPETAEVMKKSGIHQVPTGKDLADACDDMNNSVNNYNGRYMEEYEAQNHMDRTRECSKNQNKNSYWECDYPDQHDDNVTHDNNDTH